MSLRSSVLLSLLVLGCNATHAAEYLISEAARSLNLPFSEAVRVGDMLYLSGQLGILPGTTDLAPGGIEGETRQVMDNIKSVLERYGSSMDKIVKCTVMIADIAEWPRFNEVYVTYFPGPKPARSAFAAAGLALNGRVEVECWASSN
ncbi:MAG: Rid family detoxifying hydrolase [Gammaproteobacteria bacterium]|nr:Rid family detoxifying hydrolase [Gammaproteobacteria bacterium]MCZ6852714.1 Rid family detoxifying hydrolase [Gammaproteobacteria bacterium]